MRKLFLALLFLLCFNLQVSASTIKVQTLNTISTQTPTNVKLKAESYLELDSYNKIRPSYILNGKIVRVTPPQKFGKDATFYFQLDSYTDLNGSTKYLKSKYYLKYKPEKTNNSMFDIDMSDGTDSNENKSKSAVKVDNKNFVNNEFINELQVLEGHHIKLAPKKSFYLDFFYEEQPNFLGH